MGIQGKRLQAGWRGATSSRYCSVKTRLPWPPASRGNPPGPALVGARARSIPAPTGRTWLSIRRLMFRLGDRVGRRCALHLYVGSSGGGCRGGRVLRASISLKLLQHPASLSPRIRRGTLDWGCTSLVSYLFCPFWWLGCFCGKCRRRLLACPWRRRCGWPAAGRWGPGLP